MPKSFNQKLKLMYILKELQEKTDNNHTVTVAQLVEMLNSNGIKAERKSIYDDIEALRLAGYDIENRREKPAGYYLAGRDFELAELKLLVDSVQSAKFITRRKSMELIKKLENLTSKYEAQQLQRDVFVTNRIKTMNESIYYSVDAIHTAISANAKIRFQYFEWTVTKEIKLRRDGEFYEISPWGLTWDDENYYMIGYDSEAGIIKHYRVDKMLRLTVMESTVREGKEQFGNFDTAVFARKTFGMFGGKEDMVKLSCVNSMAGVVIDRFGKDVMMRQESENHFTVSVRVNVSPQFFGWVFGLGSSVQIAGPDWVREEFCRYAEEVLNGYKE
ncbi:MAG: WYL domain-containing protein [Eubacteriales bacterium]|nr:WYL domain-containing protein [Eubacteriales bacterium]